jgi:hypothetical protein
LGDQDQWDPLFKAELIDEDQFTVGNHPRSQKTIGVDVQLNL